MTKSGNYRTGFAKIATNRDIEVIPVAGQNTEEMVFQPFIWLVNLLMITKLYDRLTKLPGKTGLIFFYIKLVCSVFFGMIFIIPIPVDVTLHIGTPLKKEKNEDIVDFTKRCECELQQLYMKANNRNGKDVIKALNIDY